MRDFEIRGILRETELAQFITDPNSKVVEEFRLPVAGARIDMAVINGRLHGFEIKSSVDTLNRLSTQLIAYEKVFDFLSIVTEEKHLNKVKLLLPTWVGIFVCHEKNSNASIKRIRKPKQNKNKEGFYIAKLLWRSEIIEVLESLGIPYKAKHRNWVLCELINSNVEVNILSTIVREKLKKRVLWKP